MHSILTHMQHDAKLYREHQITTMCVSAWLSKLLTSHHSPIRENETLDETLDAAKIIDHESGKSSTTKVPPRTPAAEHLLWVRVLCDVSAVKDDARGVSCLSHGFSQ